ncbi:MAG: shikimate kinase [Pseudomonadota bacterium]
MPELAIVVSGLPASGKTTVGKAIAERLSLPFLDKDDFLEALFESDGIGDLLWRQELSQKSNQAFCNAAKAHERVVLVSHWRPLNVEGSSGTPTEWLNTAFFNVIEVYCQCPVEEALLRFTSRTRHPGHRDQDRDRQELAASFEKFANALPLQLGNTLTVNTQSDSEMERSVERVTERILQLIA